MAQDDRQEQSPRPSEGPAREQSPANGEGRESTMDLLLDELESETHEDGQPEAPHPATPSEAPPSGRAPRDERGGPPPVPGGSGSGQGSPNPRSPSAGPRASGSPRPAQSKPAADRSVPPPPPPSVRAKSVSGRPQGQAPGPASSSPRPESSPSQSARSQPAPRSPSKAPAHNPPSRSARPAAARTDRPASRPGTEPEPTDSDPLVARARALVRACETELTENPEARRAARLHFEIARLYEGPLRDLRKAAAHYQEALQRGPEHLPTIRGARRVLLARKSYQAALPLFDTEARITSDPARKAALYRAKGRVLEDALGNREDARAPYHTALELDRSAPAVLKALEQTQLDSGAWDALDRTWERAANAVSSDPRHRAALIVERARLVETRQGHIDGAIELYETALRLDPLAHDALEALKRLHHAERRWRDLIAVLEVEAEQANDSSVRTMALYRIGRLHAERLGNRSEAVGALERAASENPRDPLVLEELARLYEAGERWDALVEVLQSLVDVTQSRDERVVRLHRMGQLYQEKLGHEDAAIHCYEAARRLRPEFLPALQALGDIYARQQDWEALIRIGLGEAEHADDPYRRAAAHSRVAELLDERLGRTDEACDHYARALSLVPGYPPAFKALARIFTESRRWRELVELYERAVDLAKSKPETVAYLNKIGAVYENELGEYAQATHTYRRILQIAPDDLGAIQALQRCTERAGRWEQHVEALELEVEKIRDQRSIVALLHRAAEVLDDKLTDREGALARLRRALSIEPQHTPSLSLLGKLYYRSGRWEDLLETYKRELELAPQGTASIALLQKMAELCEYRIGRDEDAIGYYRRILQIDTRHRPALAALGRILRDRGDYRELAKVLETELGGLESPQERARTALRLGEVYEERLERPDRASTAYEQALKEVPTYRPALDALARLRAQRRAWSPLASELDRDAQNTTDPSLAITALVREGEVLAEQLNEPRRAVQCYERVLEQEPGHLGALLALERLYRRLGAWDALAHVYKTQSEVFEDTAARVTALQELARIQETRGVGGPEDRKRTYETLLDLSPGNGEALDGLERLALERGDRAMLAEVDRKLIAHTADPALRAALRTRLAEALEVEGHREALETYRAALVDDPESLGATRGLSRLAEHMDDPGALAEAARREAQVARNGEVAARLLVRSADVRNDRLGDFDGGVADLERALELSPDNREAAQRLSRTLRALKQHARLADLLARAAASAKDRERMAELWMEVAELQAEELDNLAGAISSLNRVLRTASDHIPALRRLAELYERDGQWHEAVNLLTRLVGLDPEREVLRDAHLQLASLWGERLGETSRALVSLQAVLALDPHNGHALERIADLQEQEGMLGKATEAAAQLAEAEQQPDRRAAALLRLARLEHKRGHADEARDAAYRALVLQGPGGEAAQAFKRSLQSPREWEQYSRALQQHMDQGGTPGPVHLELARVRFDHQGQANAAVSSLDRALQHLQDPESRREIAARLRRGGRPERAIQELQRLLAEDLTAVDVWRDLAQAFLEQDRLHEARLASEPLAVFDAAETPEAQLFAQAPPKPLAAGQGTLTPGVLRELSAFGPRESAASDLLISLEPGLPKLYPADLDGYGLSPRDRVTSRSGHPLRALADRIAAVLGIGEFELFVHRVRTRGVSVECGNPPAILVPASVGDLPEPRQVFLLARPLINLAQGFHAVDKLTPRELEVLLASAARFVRGDFGGGLTNEEFLAEQARRIHKSLPRRARKNMEQRAETYIEGRRVDFASWVRTIRSTSNRMAAMLADDLTACVEVMRQTERELQGLHGMALAQSSWAVVDLLRFWASAQGLELRRRTGILPPQDPS